MNLIIKTTLAPSIIPILQADTIGVLATLDIIAKIWGAKFNTLRLENEGIDKGDCKP